MTRNLKALALCVVAILAMSALVASAAQAKNNITAGEYEADVTGTQVGVNTLSNGVREVACATASLTGKLAAASSTITITPAYENCTGNASTTATVNVTGCDYLLHVEEETTATTGHGSVTIQCPVGASIDVDIWATGKSHSETKLCRLQVPAQGPVKGIEYHIETSGVTGKKIIMLTIHMSTLTVNRVEGTALNCGAATTAKGTYNGNVESKATKGGVPVDLFID
jgi:hypothetical protein